MNHVQNCKLQLMIPPKDGNAGAPVTNNEVDTAGWHYLSVIIAIGNIATADATSLTINESDTASQTGTAFVTFTAPTAAGYDNKMVAAYIDLRKRKRYIHIAFAPSANACLVGAIGLLSRGDEAAVGATAALDIVAKNVLERFIV